MLDTLPHLEAIQKLRLAFLRHDRDIRIVGGCVRDLLVGKISSDVDLCTNATPDEQRAIYEAENIRHVDTGLRHGTYTVVLYHEGEQIVLEITSLRIDTDQDGRHATVIYTHEWLLDLSRRDFTCNAISLTLDGELIDPYNGADDLKNGRVVFVGNAEERIHEDYLRILRWFRFSARYADGNLDADTSTMLMNPKVASGLLRISRERVWAEISKMLAGPCADNIMLSILTLGINEYIDLPKIDGCIGGISFAKKYTNDPIALMVAYCASETVVADLATRWKWSNDEKLRAKIICRALDTDRFLTMEKAKKMTVLGNDKSSVAEAFRIIGLPYLADELVAWEVPVIPVSGADIVGSGVQPGPKVGILHRMIRDRWIESDYRLSKEQCLGIIGE